MYEVIWFYSSATMGIDGHCDRPATDIMYVHSMLHSSHMSKNMEKERPEGWQRNRFASSENLRITSRKGEWRVPCSWRDERSLMASSTFFLDSIRIRTYDIDDDCMMIDLPGPQVQPDIDELTANMEDNEDADSKKSETPNLGKLEYSIDYDFQKQEVRTPSRQWTVSHSFLCSPS